VGTGAGGNWWELVLVLLPVLRCSAAGGTS